MRQPEKSMTTINYKKLCAEVMVIARQAGTEILRIYNHIDGFDVNAKGDNSPVTAADLAAHHVLKPGLEALLPNVPVLSEESTLPDYSVRKNWSRYWIIDPLDGTKEFIKRNGEFTVNIALVENGVAVLGVVFVPVLDLMYTGIKGTGAQKISKGKTENIKTRALQPRLDLQQAIEVVASRSHGAEDVDHFLGKISENLGSVALKNMGSSLKLCLVAEGSADIYPRLALTCEWDTAAAQAVVEAAGGKVVDIDLNVMRYNTKDDILNPYFFVLGDPAYPWEKILKS
jgi:3'(2'), 5'-bisphosphate nucleotidase